MKLLFAFLATFCFLTSNQLSSYAATVDSISIYSSNMHQSRRCDVIIPDTYRKNKKFRYPVVYLLHGYSGDFSNWIKKVSEIKEYSDQYKVIIVCPDGDYGSWYFDSKTKVNSMFETYIAEEVPNYIDKSYRTDTSRTSRAITGLSMGGHGALFIAWRHSDRFGAAASMSGGMDLSESAHKFDIEKVLGPYSSNETVWKENSIVNVIDKPTAFPISLWLDCGTSDMFIESNRKVHAKLLSLKIPHQYTERDGGHSWEYWKYSIHFQLLFFKKYFDVETLKKLP